MTQSAHTPHHHTHHHLPTLANLSKAFLLAVVLNLGFTVIEAIYAYIAHSTSLFADAVHNFGDVLGLLLAWGSHWLSSQAATEQYSYGYKRTTIIAAVSNALLLVATTAIIVFEAVKKIIASQPVTETIVIWVGIIGILINISSALFFRHQQHHDLNAKGAFLHLAADAFITLGVVLAAVIMQYTHWLWLDPTVAIVIAIIILIGTWSLLRDSVNLILDAVPHHINSAAVRDFLLAIPHVKAMHDLHIWGLSTSETALTAHLIMPEQRLTDQDYQQISQVLKERFQIHHVTLQIESGGQDALCQQHLQCQQEI